MVSELLCTLVAAVSYASGLPGTPEKKETHVASALAVSSVNAHSNVDDLPLSAGENSLALQSEGATSAYDYDVTSFVNFVTVETEELIEARRDYEHDKSPGSYPTPGYFKAIALGEQTLRATLELPSETLQHECLITITNEERP